MSLIILFLPFYIFIPGYFLNKILKLDKELNLPAIIGFAIVSSIAIINLFFILFNQFLIYDKNLHISLIFFIDALIFGIYYLFFRNKNKKNKIIFDKENLILLIIGLIPLLLFILRVFINPYLIDQDGSSYIIAMEDVQKRLVDDTFLSPRRIGFTYIVMPFYFFTDLDFLNIFKFILPAVVWLSFISLFALFNKKNNNKIFIIVSFLSILISPAFIDHIDRFKPETITFMMVLPAMIFFYFSIIKKNYIFYLLGFIYSFIAFKSHDTGLILLITYLIGGLIYSICHYKEIKSYYKKNNINFILTIIITIVLMQKINLIINAIKEILVIFPPTLSNFHFKLWFLNKYNSLGGELGWPSWTFILFYVYNGILAFILMILALVSVIRNKSMRKKQFFISVSLILLNLMIFFIVAEVLPRLGFFFLPDRAWLHLFYYSVIFIILFINFWPKLIKINTLRIMYYFVFINIISSIIISIILVLSAGSLVSRKEKIMIDLINNTPQNAVILSTQEYNNVLVERYTKKDFVYFDLPDFAKKENLSNYIVGQIQNGNITLNANNFPIIKYKIYKKTTYEQYLGIIQYSQLDTILESENRPIKQELKISQNRPIYFIYSFAKTDGYLNKIGRKYWSSGIDPDNRDFFWNYENKNIIYKDKAGIIIKIR